MNPKEPTIYCLYYSQTDNYFSFIPQGCHPFKNNQELKVKIKRCQFMVGLVVLLYYSCLAVMHIKVCYGQTMFGLSFFMPLLFASVTNNAL